MKSLLLLRHGKSEPAGSRADDRARALVKRGLKNAKAVGAYLDGKQLLVDLVLCSSARRTRETLEAMDGHAIELADIRIEDSLYLARSQFLLKTVQALPDTAATALFIGHNPGLHELAFTLIAQQKEKSALRLQERFPTCALAWLEFDVDTWFEVDLNGARLAAFVIPDDLAESS